MRKHVLIVEDDVELRQYLCLCLSTAGAAPYSAGSAEQALALLESIPDLQFAVFDVDLPGISGPELLKKMEAIPRFQFLNPIFTTGALVVPKVSYHGKSCPVLTKPYDMNAILSFMNLQDFSLRETISTIPGQHPLLPS